jgi:hypothetical protein
MVLLVGLYYADLEFLDKDYLENIFVVLALVAVGIIVLGILVSLSKDDEIKLEKRLAVVREYENNPGVQKQQKNVSKRELVFVLTLLLVTFNAAYPFIAHDFSPNTNLYSHYFLITVIITFLASAFLIYVLRKFNKKVIQKKCFWDRAEINLGLLVLPILVFALVWFNAAIAMPRFYTVYFGNESVIDGLGAKKRKFVRWNRKLFRCELLITIDELQFPFHWCLSQQEFNELPDTKFPVRVHQKTTVYGTLVTSLTAHPGTDPESRKRYFDACVEKETGKILRRYRIDLDEKLAVLRIKAIEGREGRSIEKMAEEACSRFQ